MLLARHLHELLAQHPEFEPMSQSITTFRYVPRELRPQLGSEKVESYLDELNQKLLTALSRRERDDGLTPTSVWRAWRY